MKHKYNLSSLTGKLIQIQKEMKILKYIYILSFFLLSSYANTAYSQIVLTLTEDLPISCNNANDGAFFTNVSPSGSYQYNINGGSWSASDPSPAYYNLLAPGTYTVGATDGSSDTAYATITFINPAPLSILLSVDSLPGCPGQLGGLSAVISGGTFGNSFPGSGYLTEWKNSANVIMNPPTILDPNANYNNFVGDLVGDTYTLFVEDEHYCLANASILLPSLCLFVDQNVSCKDSSDGTVQATTSLSGTQFVFQMMVVLLLTAILFQSLNLIT